MDLSRMKAYPTLRELRKARYLEVPDLARKVGARENTVYRWERGLNPPGLLDAMTIAEVLKVRVDEVNWWPHGLMD